MQPFSYTLAGSRSDAIAAFAERDGGARYIAGGTTLYDLMKLGAEVPAHLIDVTGIADLEAIETDGEVLRFGALATMEAVAATPMVRDDYPVLAESLLKAASQQLRNMASVGGNLLQRTRCAYFRDRNGLYPCNKRVPGSGCSALGGHDRAQAVLGVSEACNAVSPGDWPVALVALDARVVLEGLDGERTLPLADLYRLPGDTPSDEFAIEDGELVTAIEVPKTAAGSASTYHKIRDRESYAFALASAAVALDMDGDVVRAAHVGLGGVATVPWRARAAEEALVGRPLDREAAFVAGRLAFEGARPGAHNAFKIALAAETVAEALTIAAERSRA